MVFSDQVVVATLPPNRNNMHVTTFITQFFDELGAIGHAARRLALMKVVLSVLQGAKLSLTHLGRRRGGTAFAKHHIKAVDRLLGNKLLHAESRLVYTQLAARMLKHCQRPVLLVDWADCGFQQQWQVLRASVPMRGRSLQIFERVFPFKRYSTPGAHREFLHELKTVLPPNCRPIIVTDAGFRGPWFKEVESHGWDWVGRIRNGIKYLNVNTNRWCLTTGLYGLAKSKPQHLGNAELGRLKSYTCNLYLVRAHQPRKGKRPKGNRGGDKRHDTKYRRLHRAPWLLATSLQHSAGMAQKVMRLYERRMQIEESFRDLKCHRWGFALRYARSRTAQRLEILLLIGALATICVWLAGLAAEAKDWTKRFQANTEKVRTVLSTFFVGFQIFSNGPDSLETKDLVASWPFLLKRLHNESRV